MLCIMQLVSGFGTQCKHHDKFLLNIFGNLVFNSFSHRLGIFVFFSIRNNFVFFQIEIICTNIRYTSYPNANKNENH